MRIVPLTAVIMLAATNAGWAGEGFWEQYFLRSDSITADAGNAKDVNAAIHVIDPWPRYSGNLRIPANGARMTGAIQRYRGNGNGTANGRPDSQYGQPTPGAASAAGNLPQGNGPQ